MEGGDATEDYTCLLLQNETKHADSNLKNHVDYLISQAQLTGETETARDDLAFSFKTLALQCSPDLDIV
jgi:hypothetical protein